MGNLNSTMESMFCKYYASHSTKILSLEGEIIPLHGIDVYSEALIDDGTEQSNLDGTGDTRAGGYPARRLTNLQYLSHSFTAVAGVLTTIHMPFVVMYEKEFFYADVASHGVETIDVATALVKYEGAMSGHRNHLCGRERAGCLLEETQNSGVAVALLLGTKCSPDDGRRGRGIKIRGRDEKKILDHLKQDLMDVVFDGAFRGVGDEEVVVGEGVVVISSSLDMLTNSCLRGIMASLIFLEGLYEEAFVEFIVE
ncbi:hypothetical protein Tco_0202022 [Tanacetum coccineum]